LSQKLRQSCPGPSFSTISHKSHSQRIALGPHNVGRLGANIYPWLRENLTCNCRLTLNYKRVPYKTVWVESADIQRAMKEAGAVPLSGGKWPDGVERYSVPAIKDPDTGKVLSDSFEIAQYLDEKFPDRPTLVPKGTEAQQAKFSENVPALLHPVYIYSIITLLIFIKHLLQSLAAAGTYITWAKLSEYGKPAFEETMRQIDGGPPFAERPVPTDADFEKMDNVFERLAEAIDAHGGKNGRLYGDQTTFADFAVGAVFQWLRHILSQERFEKLLQLNGDRWKKLVDEHVEYTNVDEGVVYQPLD
jgi:glutathione S-transferase